MENIVAIFTPNRAISKRSALVIVCTWIAAMLSFWTCCTSALIPNPIQVIESLRTVWQEGIYYHLIASLKVNLSALFWSTVISLGVTYLTVVPFFRPLANMIVKLRFLGLAGLVMVFTVMSSSGHDLKVNLIVFGMSVFFVTSMLDVVAGTPQEHFDLARTLKMGEWRATYEVVILGRSDLALDAFRTNAAIGWMMLTTVEGLVRSGGGIGVYLLNQDRYMHLGPVFAAQIIILCVGLFIDYLIGVIKNVICPWSLLTLERK